MSKLKYHNYIEEISTPFDYICRCKICNEQRKIDMNSRNPYLSEIIRSAYRQINQHIALKHKPIMI